VCEVKEQAQADGIDKTQEAALKSKKRPSGIISEVEKWRQVYKIIFPGDQDIPSPCDVSPNLIL
jgi:hypothetical protein